MSKQELDSLKQALQDSLDKVAKWKREDEESLSARESYDSLTRGSFDLQGLVRS